MLFPSVALATLVLPRKSSLVERSAAANHHFGELCKNHNLFPGLWPIVPVVPTTAAGLPTSLPLPLSCVRYFAIPRLVYRFLRRRGSVSRPKLVADAGMDTHVLFTRMGLDRLKQRISELVQENKAEKNNFKVRRYYNCTVAGVFMDAIR